MDIRRLLDLTAARATFYGRAWACPAYIAYLRREEIDNTDFAEFIGATAVIPIIDCGNNRFEFGRIGVDPLGFVCEALDRDGTTVHDLVAWPLNDPTRVLSMLGRAAWFGAKALWNPASYYMGKALPVHRIPLEWMKSGFRGAAVIEKRLAARTFMDLPGPIAARDYAHRRELIALAESVVDRRRIIVAGAEFDE